MRSNSRSTRMAMNDTPSISRAIYLRNLEGVQTAIANGNILSVGHLCLACRRGNLEIFQFLVQQGKADINFIKFANRAAFHWATQYGRLNILRFCFGQENADVNAKDIHGRTA